MGIYGKRSLSRPRMTSSTTTSSVPLNYLRLKERIARSPQRITHSHLMPQPGNRIRPIYVQKKRSMTRARSNNSNSSRRTNMHSSSRISKSGNRSNNQRYLSNHNGGLLTHQIHNDVGRAYSTTLVSLDHNMFSSIQGDKNLARRPSPTPFLVAIEDTTASSPSPSQKTAKKSPVAGGVNFQDPHGHGSSRIEFGSSETLSSSEEAREMMLLKREAYRELASQTQRFDELFIAKMIYWESLGLEEKSRWLEQGGRHEEVEEDEEEDDLLDDMEDEEELRHSQHNNYYHRPATRPSRSRRETRDEIDDLVTALECRATVKDYSALLAFEKQQAQLRHGPNHTHIHGLLPQDQDTVLW